ncbi:MAG: hypothetical protein AABY32_05995 [Nanoarchaeota archaeon]
MVQRVSTRNTVLKLIDFIKNSIENKDTSKAKSELSDKLLQANDFIDAIESIDSELKKKVEDYNSLEKKYAAVNEELEDLKYKIFS